MTPRKESLSKLLYARVKDRLDPRVKRSVARRVTQKVALAVLNNRLSAWEPVHERAMALTTAAEGLPDPQFHKLFEELTSLLLVGYVMPIQAVRMAIQEASDWYLGLCVCRQARRVEDLYLPDGETVYLTNTEEECRPWLDRLVDAHERLGADDEITSAELSQLLGRLALRRAEGDPAYGVGQFFAQSWPHFEILLDHPDYSGTWRETMKKNRRVWRVHPELLLAWVDLAWFTRGVVFTSMAAVDERYTICSCPGPENDGGCILFNWTYYSGNPNVVVPARDQWNGQRQDEQGVILPCAHFPERRSKACFGCGCIDGQVDGLPAGCADPRPSCED